MALTTQLELAGAVVTPSDGDYDQARMPWNVAIDQRPAAIVFPADVRDVVAAVRHARANDLQVAVQSTGHGAHTLGDLGRTLLIRPTAMTGVHVDPVRRTARVGAGVQWQDVAPLAAEHGLAALAGSSPDVGVVGYSLGGGLGYLSRPFGLQSNHVTAVELVTASGDVVRADADSEQQLFWALRGAGHGFGVVTAMEFALEPIAELYGGAMFWPWERSREILAAWRDVCAEAPRTMTTVGRILNLPPITEVPEPLRGRQFVNVQVAHAGAAAEAEAALAPLKALAPELDFTGPLDSPAALIRLHGDPEAPTPGIVGGGMIDSLPDATLDALVEAAGPGSRSPLVQLEIRQLGGALAEVPAGAGVLGRLDGAFAWHSVGVPAVPELVAPIEATTARVSAAMRACGSGREYTNFAGRAVASHETLDLDSAARLQALRRVADPSGLFHAGHGG
jgi:FAD/FMN-containing dehydrogenase